MNEFAIIKKYFAPLAKAQGALGLTDDAALMTAPAGKSLVVTKDAMVEGVHFVGDESPALIAQKLLRVNLSDLAAMGATPHAYFLALMLPQADERWLRSFAQGLSAAQKTFGITLMGGDTTKSPTLSLSLTAVGFVPKGEALKRTGARAGDDIYVSGTIGDAALGLRAAQGKFKDAYLLKRYRLPTPRLMLGSMLLRIATACADVSDGLIQDLGHIAECSEVGAVVEWDKIPLSPSAKKMKPVPEIIAAGGDDYELLFTAPQKMREKIAAIATKAKTPVTRIGSIRKGRGVKLVDKTGKEITLRKTGYDHFGSR